MGETSLNYQQYKEYFKRVKDLEIACYQLTEMSKNLQQMKYRTERKKWTLPECPARRATFVDYICEFLFTLLKVAVLSFVCGFGGVIVWLFHSGNGFWDNFIGGGGDAPTEPYVIPGMIIGCAIGLFSGIHKMVTANKECEKKYKEYQNQVHMIEAAHSMNNASLKNIDAALIQCNNELTQTRNILDQYYDLGYIHKSYRGLVPVCTIYQYLDSGRCFTLEGHEGAYNLYESELRMNIILGKLDDVISRLDDISSSQQLLVDEIRKSNDKIDRLCNQAEEIQNSAAVTQYYSQITAMNTTYLTWVNFLKSKK